MHKEWSSRESRQESWGIVRYAPDSGDCPDEDACCFDGWYADREEALAIAREWEKEHPAWTVALISADTIWFSDQRFDPRVWPLTAREWQLEQQVRDER